jgi:exopolysaccharide biosynthesis protein
LIVETTPDLSEVDVAIGGGPALVMDGKVMSWKGWIHMRHPRTALGWNKTHIFLVEVDGRQSDVSVGMTFSELADYMRKLGCDQAMNLDGGGSATLWAFGAVRNSPSEGQERPSPNGLVVVRKNSHQATK